MSCAVPDDIANAGNCVHKMVTPRVVDIGRKFFDCDALNGVELENNLKCGALQGSHWEQRYVSTEFMTSYSQHKMIVSALTLALFEDSGWYHANYSAADSLRPGVDFGFRQGCAFAVEKCIYSSAGTLQGRGNPPHYYPSVRGMPQSNAVCTTDRVGIGYVALSTYTSALPTQYQYFAGQPTVGGNLDVADYCPMIQLYSNARCDDTSNNEV